VCSLRYANPIVSLTVLPLPLPFGLVFNVEEYTMSMHQIVIHLPNVFVSICKDLCSVSIHFALFELAFITISIRPGHDSLALHVVFFKLSFI
jgi:hypothetical protein